MKFWKGAVMMSARSYQLRERFTIATTDSITGTSTRTPTTAVASAAPEFSPNRLTAAATASSKKLLAPISAAGAATHHATEAAGQPIGKPRVEIDLNQDRHRQQQDHDGLRENAVALKSEQQHKGCQQCAKRQRLEHAQGAALERAVPTRQQQTPPDLGRDHRRNDVERDRQVLQWC